MKLYIPSMVWHGEKERILTLAFHPFMNLLVTGGSDGQKGFEEDAKQTTDDIGHIKMWEMRNTSEWLENQPFNFLGALGGHTSTVNCLKFSPNG
jgi:WD40 repeat protein